MKTTLLKHRNGSTLYFLLILPVISQMTYFIVVSSKWFMQKILPLYCFLKFNLFLSLNPLELLPQEVYLTQHHLIGRMGKCKHFSIGARPNDVCIDLLSIFFAAVQLKYRQTVNKRFLLLFFKNASEDFRIKIASLATVFSRKLF